MFRTCNNRILHVVVFSFYLILCVPVPTNALPNDNKESIHINSASTTYNFKTGINIFEGHVSVDQGATHITADRLITKSDISHKIHEVVAYGLIQPAHYWTLPKAGDPEIHANAKIIRFYPIQSNITLEQNDF